LAKYRRSKVSIDDEMNIAIGCIMSDKFTRDFILLIGGDLDLLKSKYLRTIISWAITYYKDYGDVCGSSIMNIFKAERKNIQNEDDVDLIEDTLENINEKYIENEQKFDHNYIFQQVTLYIRGRSLEENTDQIKGLLAQNKVLEAEKIHVDFKRKEKGDLVGVDIFKDFNAIDDLFAEEDSVFKMGGALGELMGDVYYGDLCYVGGPSKASKTWTTMELALECAASGLNVMWISLEMSTLLMNRRFMTRIAGGSFKESDKEIYVPYFDENSNVQYGKEKVKKLTPSIVKRRYKLYQQQSKSGKLVVYDATTTGNTVGAIKNAIVTAEEFHDFKYQVIFVDQLNLLKTYGISEKRHQLDAVALELKREIAQDLNKLVFSPVQYNRASLKQDTNDESSISESYSIYTHCSLLISLNQTKSERERGLLRISCSGRHSNYSGMVLALQCLDLGRAVMDSKWLKNVPNYKDIILDGTFGEDDEQDLEDI